MTWAHHFFSERQRCVFTEADDSVDEIRSPERPSLFFIQDRIHRLETIRRRFRPSVDAIKPHHLHMTKESTSTKPSAPIVGFDELVEHEKDPCLCRLQSIKGKEFFRQV